MMWDYRSSMLEGLLGRQFSLSVKLSAYLLREASFCLLSGVRPSCIEPFLDE